MKNNSLFTKSIICSAIVALLAPSTSYAAPYSLSSTPANGAYKRAAPNVIVAVDDSFSMGVEGIKALKEALKITFTTENVPDGTIRLAWQSMWRCPGIPSCKNDNGIRPLDSDHRTAFLEWVDQLNYVSSTPSHRMLYLAGEYLKKPLDVHSAWAAKPGKELAPVLACRRAYNIFMTDGGWNSRFLPSTFVDQDDDGTNIELPDGTKYIANSSDTKIYRGRHWGDPDYLDTYGKETRFNTTFSDLAFRYWATDLQPNIPNSVKPIISKPGAETFTSGKVSNTIPEYWNPRNDPATWQHMNLYTVGYNDAANWWVSPKRGTSTWTGGDYDALMTGEIEWENPIHDLGNTATAKTMERRKTELWHAAINSRGQFIPASTAESLTTAFKEILSEFLVDRSTPIASLAASARTTRTNSAVYAAEYSPASWSGSVTGYQLKKGGVSLETTGLWGDIAGIPAKGSQPAIPSRPKSTADLMDAQPKEWPAKRVVLSSVTDGSGTSSGVSWEWDSLSDAQKNGLKTVDSVLDSSSAASEIAHDRLRYLRGDRTKEESGATPLKFRQRASRQGDIVNSKLWFLSGQPSSAYSIEDYAGFRKAKKDRIGMVYVGANDGMLHGFDAKTGTEKIAYVPDGLHSKLANLTSPGYRHAYYVDGSPLTGDIYLGTPKSKNSDEWKTYLAGFLGAGGRGYFILDVTDPSTFDATNASSLVVMDKTSTIKMDDDVGHILSDPVTEEGDPSVSRQITRMNNGRWALVIGNGYNSKSEKAVLLVQYLDGDKELLKIQTDDVGSKGNGLSAPRLIDLNGDHTPDLAYAGDLQGNLWKFDLTSSSPTEWKVASNSTPAVPLFVAKDDGGNRQSITGAPVWKPHSKAGVMLAFATGRNLSDADRASVDIQTIYGVHDASTVTLDASVVNPSTGAKQIKLGATTLVSGGRSALVKQEVTGSETAKTSGQHPLWTTSSNLVPYGSGGKQGWFLDLPVKGERVLQNLAWFKGDLIHVSSTVPAIGGSLSEESCDPPPAQPDHYRTTIDIENGARPVSQIYAYNTGHVTDTQHEGRIKQAQGIEFEAAPGKTAGPVKSPCVTPGSAGCSGTVAPSLHTFRPSWRQAQ